MIQGRILTTLEAEVDATEVDYRTIVSMFIEPDERKNRITICEKSLYQFMNCDQGIGVILGTQGEKIVILVFSDLENFELYQNLTAVYLYSDHLTIEFCCQKIVEVLQKENATTSMLLMEPGRKFFVSSLEGNHGSNVTATPLLGREYFLRDWVLQEGPDEAITLAMEEWKGQTNSQEAIASDLAHHILSQIEGFPKPIGSVITIFQQNSDSILLNLPIEKEKKNQIQKPKNPVTAFNFYSSVNRHAVAAEFRNAIHNNDLNKELGRRWNMMSKEEKYPYERQAAEDKKRYAKDLEKMKKIDEPLASKPLTAYNHFVHQEKQFIVGLSLRNTQTTTGRHGGDRWSAMHPDEKRLYQVLREAEVQEYQAQF